jgi:hypothetical protein
LRETRPHFIEVYGPLLVDAAIKASCATVGKTPPPQSNPMALATRRPSARHAGCVRDAKSRAGPLYARGFHAMGPRACHLWATFLLRREDSGSPDARVVWQTAPGDTVRLIGRRSLPSSAFQPVTDTSVLARLNPEARGQVVEADLRALGVTELPPFPDAYHGAPPMAAFYTHFQSRRDCVLQPRVARNELPWEMVPKSQTP